MFKGYGSITQKPLSKAMEDNMVQEVTRLEKFVTCGLRHRA